MKKTSLSALMLMPLEAFAYDAHSEYRIYGEEIVSITAPEIEVEEPATLIIDTARHGQLVIESDGLLDDCKNNLTLVKGDPSASVQIVVHENSATLNGVLVVQCSVIYR